MPRTVSAIVYLKSLSGDLVRDLGTGPLPEDLSAFRAPKKAVEAVCEAFRKRRFEAFVDSMGLTITIEASPSRFTKVFGVARKRLLDLPATETLRLAPPEEVRELVEEIVVLPRPELH